MSAAEKLMAELVEIPAAAPAGPSLRERLLADFNADPALIDKAEPPEHVVHNRMPVGGASLAAPGGSGKTTLKLIETVHIACGADLYGEPTVLQGPCVLVTAEDGPNYYRYVLRRILEDGLLAGALPDRAVRTAKHGIKIVGWSRAEYGPLAVLDPSSGDMRKTSAFETLIDIVGSMNPRPVYISLDPAVLFGPGERYGNDGDAFLASMIHEAALKLRCCFQLIDHVSQTVARTGIVDQYAARGGTAKTDNLRLARQLVRYKGGDDGAQVPIVATPEDITEGRILQLHWTKGNYGPQQPMVWLRRRGFWIETLRGVSAEEAADNRRATQEQQRLADAQAVVSAVSAARVSGQKPTSQSIEDAGVLTQEGNRLSRQRLRAAISTALMRNLVVQVELPEGDPLRRGKRTSYLDARAFP